MDARTAALLVEINHGFYHSVAESFSSTRRRIQPGVRRTLDGLPRHGRWLDLGCGNGWLAVEWARSGREGAYLGLDFSAGLLADARRATTPLNTPEREMRFAQADLAGAWSAGLEGQYFDGIFVFAVLHHIPGAELRAAALRQAAALLPFGGRLIHSVWQFQHSAKLLARVAPWEAVGLSPDEVDEGDALLDWRAPHTGAQQSDGHGEPALRYVHRFSLAELDTLAVETGFIVIETYESDGEGGRLGLYQVWVKG